MTLRKMSASILHLLLSTLLLKRRLAPSCSNSPPDAPFFCKILCFQGQVKGLPRGLNKVFDPAKKAPQIIEGWHQRGLARKPRGNIRPRFAHFSPYRPASQLSQVSVSIGSRRGPPILAAVADGEISSLLITCRRPESNGPKSK
jgi:hypothetical protein